MFRKARPTAVVAAAVFVLAACGGADTAPGAAGEVQNATITFWDNNAGPDRTPVYEELISRFETANPGIQVEYVGLPSDTALQKYQTAIAGGSPPDVGVISTTYLSAIGAQDVLLPLDDLLAGSPLAGEIAEGDLTAVRETGGGEQLLALPLTSNTATLWYRTDLFAAKNLTPPATWDEFHSAALALTDLDAQQYGFTLRGGAGSIYPLMQDMYAYSGIDSFFDAQGGSTIADPRNVEAIEKLAALYETATPTADVNNNFTQMIAQFGSGNTAMMQHNLGSLANHEKALAGRFAAVPLPAAADGSRTVVTDPYPSYTIFESSPNQAAAWRFVEFMMSAESDSFWNESSGQIPTNTAAREDDWVRDTQSVQAALAVLDDPATTLVTPPLYLPEFGKIVQVDMPPLWQKVILGELSAQDFATQFAAAFTDAQAKFEARG